VKGVVLQVDQQGILDATLEVGSVSQQVEVVSQVPIVNTETGHRRDRDRHAPDSGSTPELEGVWLAGHIGSGAVTDNGEWPATTFGSPFSQTVTAPMATAPRSITPDRRRHVKESLFRGLCLIAPPDAINEFNLETNIYDASFGLTAGSTVNLATKSGANQIHGAAYEFLHNSDLDARNFFGLNQTNP